MAKDKLGPADKADIVVLRGLGYSGDDIAERLSVTSDAIYYWLAKYKRRSEQVGPVWAFIEVMIQAGPAYPLLAALRGIGAPPEQQPQ